MTNARSFPPRVPDIGWKIRRPFSRPRTPERDRHAGTGPRSDNLERLDPANRSVRSRTDRQESRCQVLQDEFQRESLQVHFATRDSSRHRGTRSAAATDGSEKDNRRKIDRFDSDCLSIDSRKRQLLLLLLRKVQDGGITGRMSSSSATRPPRGFSVPRAESFAIRGGAAATARRGAWARFRAELIRQVPGQRAVPGGVLSSAGPLPKSPKPGKLATGLSTAAGTGLGRAGVENRNAAEIRAGRRNADGTIRPNQCRS